MFSNREMPSPSSLFAAYASMTASAMLFRSMANDLVPRPVRAYLLSALQRLFKSHAPTLTLVIDESTGMARNQLFDAASVYLSTKISPKTERLKISKAPKEKGLKIRLEKGEKLVDSYEDMELHWHYVCSEPEKSGSPNDPFFARNSLEKKFFELRFHRRHQHKVVSSYLPFVLEKAKAIGDEERVLKMFTLNNSYGVCGGGIKWDSINLEHPAKFDTLAMDGALKASVIEDLDRFVKRKEFYNRVGRAWKRGYLLYGPPGTGKSSLVAAMANHLKFDIYDLQLANILRDSDLRRLLLATANRSILVIEDIDCSVDLPDRQRGGGVGKGRKGGDQKLQFQQRPQYDNTSRTSLTLSGLLNFIDGLWSSCGDERIIIFTTNHKDRLDPALLRPGRMDMHIHMSYCTYQGFKLLGSTYLGIQGGHRLFGEIELLMDEAEVTPAQVAEELMRSEDADVALEGLVKLLKRKKMEGDKNDNENDNAVKNRETKRQKTDKSMQKEAVKSTKRKINLRRRGNLRPSK